MNIKLNTNDFLQALSQIGLTSEEIEILSKENEFIKRKGGKINAETFLMVLLSKSVLSAPSFNDLAATLDASTGISVSKQAIAKKITNSCLKLLKVILGKAISAKAAIDKKKMYHTCRNFKRLIVQDSTVIRLPDKLYEVFSGVRNAYTTVSNARIQVVYDLLAEDFLQFSIDSYSVNDIKAAPELELCEGDFTLRDRGYISYGEIERHVASGADTIYRHKQTMVYLDPETEEEIPLLKILKENGRIDMDVLLNNRSRTPIRLVAAPVSEEVANVRKMKLRKETKEKNPSEYLLCLMSWSIFVTTVKKSIASFKEIFAMYELRWRIEIIFKSWKSNMNFSQLHNVSEIQLRIIITARITTIVLINRLIYAPAYARIFEQYGRRVSLMKLTKFLNENTHMISEIIEVLHTTEGKHPILSSLSRYCTYEKRKKRLNFAEKMDNVFELWA